MVPFEPQSLNASMGWPKYSISARFMTSSLPLRVNIATGPGIVSSTVATSRFASSTSAIDPVQRTTLPASSRVAM
jgi:hypothetical protein